MSAIDLAQITSAALDTAPPNASLQIHTSLAPAHIVGDAALLEGLVGNLLDNARQYNIPAGHIEVSTGTRHDRAYLTVINTGPVVPADQVQRLFEPFQRLQPGRAAPADGHHGLGLSIVKAIATAHDTAVRATPRPEGGLHIRIDFPTRPTRQDGGRVMGPVTRGPEALPYDRPAAV